MRQIMPILCVVAWPLLTAGSCATTSDPIIVTRDVLIEVARSCIPAKEDPGDPPVYKDAYLKSAADPAERYQMIASANLQRRGRLEPLERILKACR